MRKVLPALLILLSVCGLLITAYYSLNIGFLIKPPVQKLQTVWNEDIVLLEKTKSLPKEWADIKDVAMKSDNSPAQDWLPKLKVPVKLKPTGRYRLDLFFIHWLDGNRYGVVVQYNLVDLVNSNTIWELNRTYKLGYIY